MLLLIMLIKGKCSIKQELNLFNFLDVNPYLKQWLIVLTKILIKERFEKWIARK